MTRPSPAEIFQEARRRRVFHIVAMYIVGAFIALQVADLAFPGLSIPETAIQYIWIGVIIGFPFALFFGWRFDLVDGRILRTAAVNGAPGLPIGKGDNVMLAIMSVALVAICVGLAFEISQTRVDDPGRPRLADAAPNSVAVLPFANFGGVLENEYLADGLTETLLHALAQAPGLMVTARTSSFYYKGKDIDVRDIAAELGVSKVLEGSVQQSGDKIRIVAQLIEADTGFHLWSNTYDHDLGDIFAIQDSIASNVAMAILATVTAAPGLSDTRLTGVSTTNFDAYQKYLQGLEQARISSNLSLPKAEVLLQQALAIDAGFFEARKELAYATLQMEDNGTIPREAALGRLRPLMDKLLEERPDDGMSIAMDAQFRFLQDRESIDNDDLVTRLVAAIEREPNETRVYSYLAQVLRRLDRQDEAIEWLNRAIIVDPLDHALYIDLAVLLRSLGNSQASIEAYEKVTEINPQWPTGHAYLAWARYNAGDHVGWYQGMSRAAALDPLDYEMELALANGLIDLGLYDESNKHIARASKINAANGGEWLYSSFLSLLGDPAESRILTESFLRRELSARGFGHIVPVLVYISASINEGKMQEALAVFEEIIPGITAEEFISASNKEFYFQFGATIGWAQGKEISEVSARLDKLAPHWSATQPISLTYWAFTVPTAFLRGDLEEASRIAIESLSSGADLALITYRHLYPYNVVAEQPAVAAQLTALEETRLPGREAVQAYIAEQEDSH
jgi:TolB-like protein/tetratricopeptide (TPR) repeat protein